MNENEIWKDIDGYEGLYQISNYGQVKSLKDNHGNPREKILKGVKNHKGYLRLTLYKNKKMINYSVHRLVAQAFIDNPNNFETVNHINEDKTDNRACNLEWMSVADNNRYGTGYERRSIKQINDPKKSKKIYQYTLDGTLVTIWKSMQECKRNGYNRKYIAECCKNCYMKDGNNVYKNYIWSYNEL